MRKRTAERKERILSRSTARTMRDYAKMNHTIRPHSEYAYDPAFARKIDFFVGQELVNVGRLGGGNARWRITKVETHIGTLRLKLQEVPTATKLSDILTLRFLAKGYGIEQRVVVGQVIYSATWRVAPEYDPPSRLAPQAAE